MGGGARCLAQAQAQILVLSLASARSVLGLASPLEWRGETKPARIGARSTYEAYSTHMGQGRRMHAPPPAHHRGSRISCTPSPAFRTRITACGHDNLAEVLAQPSPGPPRRTGSFCSCRPAAYNRHGEGGHGTGTRRILDKTHGRIVRIRSEAAPARPL